MYIKLTQKDRMIDTLHIDTFPKSFEEKKKSD